MGAGGINEYLTPRLSSRGDEKPVELATHACHRSLLCRRVRQYSLPYSHSASSTVTPSGPERKTSLRSWKCITSFRN